MYKRFPKTTQPSTPQLGANLRGTPATTGRNMAPIPFKLLSSSPAQQANPSEDPFTTPTHGRTSVLLGKLKDRTAKAQRVTASPSSSGLKIAPPALTYPFITDITVPRCSSIGFAFILLNAKVSAIPAYSGSNIHLRIY